LARRESDLLLWIDALSTTIQPPATDVPTIVLGRPGVALDRVPEVYIPVGIPGIDHPGHWYRSDVVCSLPLGRLRESTAPPVDQVMSALTERLKASE
jgi:formylmethanofuran dehydrogenase subunit B